MQNHHFSVAALQPVKMGLIIISLYTFGSLFSVTAYIFFFFFFKCGSEK